ncbi:hypothetical protein TD95_004760 [Thielaviopsis punctulata]|uniref:Copper-fist domain-containing protein n=1 Tax=Thielaviopsis punctulata TaxID=72032 RepID=A0A0F4ZFS8_9PEZI|nr:hypothetical protein TD95_004760 [Thielaviopsis punctulata]
MPIIDGIKMACVPCIRGHRSTKCNHANERVMVPVRKPGRPLSICPHPSSKPCSCGVTAAIPKKPTCPCSSSSTATTNPDGPDRAVDSTIPAKEETAAASAASNGQRSCAASAASPAPAKKTSTSTPSANRVQKTQSSKARKYSFDPSILSRIDSSQANILPAALTFDASQAPPLPPVPQHVAVMDGFDAKYMSDTLMQTSAPQQPMQIPMMVPLYAPIPGAILAAHMAGHISSPLSSSSPAPGFMSASLVQSRVKSEPDIGAHFRNVPCDSVPEPAPAKKSCCSGGGAKSANGTASPAERKTNNNSLLAMAQSQTSQAQMQPDIPMNAFCPSFSYPPQIGSFMQPLNPEQWRSLMDSYAATQAVQPASAQIMVGANEYETTNGPQQQQQQQPKQQQPQPQEQHPPQPPPDAVPCTCGDSCQCLGCWWHPYNQTTTEQVMEAYNAMWDDTLFDNTALSPLDHQPISTSSAAPVKSPPPIKSCCSGNKPSPSLSPPSPSTTALGKRADRPAWTGAESSAVVTPSDASGAVEDQTLSADTFLFVHYPIHGTCLGESVSCPCGDDCECLGCVVHGNANTGEQSAA